MASHHPIILTWTGQPKDTNNIFPLKPIDQTRLSGLANTVVHNFNGNKCYDGALYFLVNNRHYLTGKHELKGNFAYDNFSVKFMHH